LANVLDQIGESLLISLVAPYKNLTSILSYEDVVEGEDSMNSLKKEFRWSVDNVTYSDYLALNADNLRMLSLNPKNPFWIQYRYTVETLEPGHEMDFVSISLETVTEQGQLQVIPQYECCGDSANACNNLILECCASPAWNPYALGAGVNTYKFLSKVVSNIFGFCVQYYKTEADQRSKDVILKEYTLFNVIDSKEVKIVVPDNELPTREIQFNPLGMDYAMDTFEIHIVKSEFEGVFGIGKRPEAGDYLYFPIMNKMYEVNSIANPDDVFYAAAYWRVGIVTYQERTNTGFIEKNIEEEVQSMISSVESVFGEEAEQEEIKARKPNEYNTIGTGNDDYVRRILDKKLLIKEEKIYNNWTVIGKYHYSLGSMEKGSEAVRYRYQGGISANEDRSFTFWFRPQYNKPQSVNSQIVSVADSDNFAQLVTSSPNGYSVGDQIVIQGTSVDGIAEVTAKPSATAVVIDRPYVNSTVSPTAKSYKLENCKFLSYVFEGIEDFSIQFTPEHFIVSAMGTKYVYNLKPNVYLNKGEFYAGVLNFSNTFQQMSLFLWQSTVTSGVSDPTKTASLQNVFSQTYQFPEKIEIPSLGDWKLLGCQTDLTNIRIFRKPIEIEEQSLVLSQYVVNDNNLAEIIDNASPQLRLAKVSNAR
jgi:hypothetical protein